MNAYERFVNFLAGKPVDHVPAYPLIMTFAARHGNVLYRDYCLDFRKRVECQMRVLDDFDAEIVSTDSDAFRETADCGAEIEYWEDDVPACKNFLLKSNEDLAKLKVPEPYKSPRMLDSVNAIGLFQNHLKGQVPIMGWVEGPLAQACALRGINEVMLEVYEDMGFVLDLCEFATQMEIGFARAQVSAGADLIGIGDAAASLTSEDFYKNYVLPCERRIVDAVHQTGAVARLHICGNTNHLLRYIAETGADLIDLDFEVDLKESRRQIGKKILLGNFHPVKVLLEGTTEEVRENCKVCHEAAGPPHIIAPGCEVSPATPPENYQAMLSFARETPGP